MGNVRKRIILIDLDGVLNEYNKKDKFCESRIPDIRNEAKEFIKKLYAQGKYRLILFSTRNLLLCAKWLIDNELDIYFYDITNVKVPAFLYIDDRAICFNGDYLDTLRKVENFNVWWN